MGDLAGVRGPQGEDGRNQPPDLYLGHFMRPYFRDIGVHGRVVSGPPTPLTSLHHTVACRTSSNSQKRVPWPH